MTQIQPQTIAYDLMARMNNELGMPKEYLDMSTHFPLRSIFKECEKLIKVLPSTGYILKSRLYAYVGDVEKFKENYCLAKRYEVSVPDEANYAVGLTELGLFSEAQEFVIKFLPPKTGGTNYFWKLAVITGSYSILAKAITEAKSMGVELSAEVPQDELDEIIFPMKSQGIDELLIAKYLDLAGAILRKRKRFLSGVVQLATPVDMDDNILIHQRVYVDEDPEIISDMNMELMEAIVENNIPQSDMILVSFEGVD